MPTSEEQGAKGVQRGDPGERDPGERDPGERSTGQCDASEAVKALYAQVCGSHDQIADFRAKLLGLLPLASGAGIFLLLTPDAAGASATGHLLPVGLFGASITLALFIYELRGIQKCLALIRSAKSLEAHFGPAGERFGAFRSRPDPVWGKRIGVRGASTIIYSAVVGAWVYVAANGLFALLWIDSHPTRHVLAAAGAGLVLAAVTGLWANRILRLEENQE